MTVNPKILELNKKVEVTQFYADATTFKPTEADEDGKRAFRTVAASDKPTSDFRRILPEGLPIVAADLSKGQPMLVNHDTYGFNGDALPIGKTLTGTYRKKLQLVEADFYLDDEDYTARILSGIDKGSITDVSIGASGTFKCSYDGSKMGWFGCYKNGHYRGQEIMLDKDGNETDKPSESVTTVFIYANFEVRLVDELSIVWKGAVSDANIIKKYHHDPVQNTEIVNAIRSVYDNKHLHEHELERLCASYGGVQSVLNQSKAPVSIPVAKNIGGNTVSKPTNLSPEATAFIDELETSKAQLQTQLEAAETRITELEAAAVSEEDAEAAVERIAELEASEAQLQQDIEGHEAKSELYDKIVVKLRGDLKLAKRRSGASKDELDTFSTTVDEMNDAANMLALLDEIRGNKPKTASSFAKVLNVDPPKEQEPTDFDVQERARIASAF